jgi:small GTP-binding protein
MSQAQGGREPSIQKKICMVGSFGVGKTSLVRRFVESIFDERYHTTIGVRIDRKHVSVEGTLVNLVLWDLAGEDEISQIRLSHLRGASGYILVADGCREATLEAALRLQKLAAATLGEVPFVLAINKADLRAEWRIDAGALEELRGSHWLLFETSALSGNGVEEMFLRLAHDMLKKS